MGVLAIMGSVLGSRKKAVTVFLSPCRTENMVLELGGKHVRNVVEGDGQAGPESWALSRQQVSYII